MNFRIETSHLQKDLRRLIFQLLKKRVATRHQAELAPATARLQKAMVKKMADSLEEGFPGFPQGGVPGFGGN